MSEGAKPTQTTGAPSSAGADASTIIDCGETLDIASVRDLWAQAKDALVHKRHVVIDAASVSQADTASLQTLCCFMQDAHGEGMDVAWGNASDAFVRTAKLIGVDQILGLNS